MRNFVDFGLNEAYQRVEQLGDRLAEIESMLDRLGHVSPDSGRYVLFDNRSERGGRPNIDEVVMVKLLVLHPAMARALRSRTGEAGCG